jgi:hypothetical protein
MLHILTKRILFVKLDSPMEEESRGILKEHLQKLENGSC